MEIEPTLARWTGANITRAKEEILIMGDVIYRDFTISWNVSDKSPYEIWAWDEENNADIFCDVPKGNLSFSKSQILVEI